VAAKYILAALSVVFLVMAGVGTLGARGRSRPQHRTWLLVGCVFAAVSAWLFLRG
jgi:DMSO reductase anchor subunit